MSRNTEGLRIRSFVSPADHLPLSQTPDSQLGAHQPVAPHHRQPTGSTGALPEGCAAHSRLVQPPGETHRPRDAEKHLSVPREAGTAAPPRCRTAGDPRERSQPLRGTAPGDLKANNQTRVSEAPSGRPWPGTGWGKHPPPPRRGGRPAARCPPGPGRGALLRSPAPADRAGLAHPRPGRRGDGCGPFPVEPSSLDRRAGPRRHRPDRSLGRGRRVPPQDAPATVAMAAG